MPDFNPTPEQRAIVEFAQDETANLAVIARAGAAKTSTLVLLAEALPDTKILCLAFNKKIAEEMTARLPSHCESRTLHSIGMRVWLDYIRKRPKVNGGKMRSMFKALVEKLSKEDQQAAWDMYKEIMDTIGAGKQAGWLPDDFVARSSYKSHIDDESFFAGLPMEPTQLHIDIVKRLSEDSFMLAVQGVSIDFDDMIMCPCCAQVSWPTYDLTLVDEAQDLSYLNHYILGKIVKRKRLIAVGDPCQAIYGFRGADADSMNRLQQKFDMKALYLTVSFRCGKKITENAQWRAPDMTSPEWAQEGEVHRKASWHIDEIEDGDAIVCRNNAPLFSLAIKLLKAGRLPEIAGRDIAAPIIKLMGKLGKDNLSSGAALAAVEEWKERELKRARDSAKRLVHDKADIMKIMLEQTQTLGDAKAYLQSLVDRDGRVYLMTGHKSKGLEFDRVWFLDPQLIKKKEDQDANIQYVIETRPKKFLAYVTSDTFEI